MVCKRIVSVLFLLEFQTDFVGIVLEDRFIVQVSFDVQESDHVERAVFKLGILCEPFSVLLIELSFCRK